MQESETSKSAPTRRRASKACMNCRVRKVRCDVVRNPQRCTNCALDDAECTVVARRAKYFQQQQEGKDTAVTGPISPYLLDQDPFLFQSPSDHSPESPSTCFEGMEDLTARGCIEKVYQQPVIQSEVYHDLESCEAPYSVTSRQSAGPNSRSHITYSYYPFLTLDMSGLEPDDVHYLESRNCLSVPTPDALDDFIREYFLHVHPGLPLLDEADFWAVYSGDKEPCGGPTISLFLLQAMLFVSCSFVPFTTLKCLGFTSRRNAREKYYRRAKLLLDICSGRDLVSNAQGALLLTYYATTRDRARTNSILLATAIQYAQGAEADQFHKRPDQDSDITNSLQRLWWCCIVRDRILPLGVRRQLHITSINPALDHLTEQDFEKEILGSQVYSEQPKRSLTVYGMGQSAADSISPMIENQKHIEESIKFCEVSLDAWFDKASIQFPTPAGITSTEKSLVLYTNLMYIYYHSARVALYQYEAFVVSLTSPGPGMDGKLHQTRLQLEDATLGITDNLKELVQLKVARFLPVSIIAYAALPLVLHILDVKLAKLPSQTARKQGRLNMYMEAMKGLQNLYDGVDDVWNFIRAAIDSATSGTLDACSSSADSIPSSALCSKPSPSILVADDWGKFLLQEPILYFRLSRTIDLSLAVGCYAVDSSLSPSLATAQFPSPSLIFVGFDVPAENQTPTISCDNEKGNMENQEVCTEVRSDIFDDIGELNGYDFGAESFQTPEFLDMFELECDEERPSCAQCRRGGRTCPGYVREMKFVDEGPKVRHSRRKAHTPAAPSQVKASQGDARHNGDQLYLRGTSRNIRLAHPSSFKAERDQILSSFVSAMFPLGSSTAQISFLGSWLWHLPPRLGSSAVLDHAALSVAWAYFAKLYGDPIALRSAEISYLCAVRSLASALDDVKEQLSSNVLCATVLLGHFETFVNVSYAWIRHAGGASRLMQLRGAQRCYESAFEYSMFLACRGAIISEALASMKPCILESENWQNIPDGLIEFPLLPASPDMYHRIFGYFALIPGLQSRIGLCDKSTSDETQSALLSMAQQLRQDMRHWYQEYTSQDSNLRNPRAIFPVLEGYPFRSQYVYHDVMSATIIVAYYAYLIVLNLSIAVLDASDKDASETQGLATAIYYETWFTYCSFGIAYPVPSMDQEMDGEI
ncbi:cutinase transcription factor 1 beta [Fusarium phyllophilum]|uniref:Cutinase transcription factor 1 beta n=1 Tax=Fusarium phyllophilum TaxID=47803 RepID=A0A8H5K7Q0_9HYPO|nr:cutinase transcription factor 1 beta [Fusarium phyllophilum]